MAKHLGVFSDQAINSIFSGKKTIESRFSQKRIAPFGEVKTGDIVFVKPPGKEIVGQFKVKKVLSFEGLDRSDWELIKTTYGDEISLGTKKADKEFFDKHKSSKFGTLIFIGSLEQFITSPVRIRKSDLRGWVVLG